MSVAQEVFEKAVSLNKERRFNVRISDLAIAITSLGRELELHLNGSSMLEKKLKDIASLINTTIEDARREYDEDNG